MGKVFIEMISNIYSITGDPLADTVLFAIAGLIAFCFAFGIVGMLFDALGYYDSSIMSGTHWFIRIIIFVAITWLFKQIFKLIHWLFSFQWWTYIIAILVIIIAIITISMLKSKRSRKQLKTQNLAPGNSSVKTEESPLPVIINKVISTRDHCPRCGQRLVKRNGPYGGFWGCEGFPKCTYTRSFR